MKSAIVAAHGTREKSTLYLIGRVPVPYSGNENPDGHGDHKGAWPADCKYTFLLLTTTNANLRIRPAFYTSLIDNYWTDSVVNNPGASDPRNQNVPGDGKYDQTYVDRISDAAYPPPQHMQPYVVAELEVQ